MNVSELKKLNISEMKTILKSKKLSTTGKKDDLIKRIMDTISEKPALSVSISSPKVKQSIGTDNKDFAAFIRRQFADFKLKGNDDAKNPCDLTTEQRSGIRELLDHQKFLVEYMKYHNEQGNERMKSRGLMLYHALGSGKTASAIAMADSSRVYTNELTGQKLLRKIVILVPAALKNSPWIEELSIKYPDYNNQTLLTRIGIHLVHYNTSVYMDQLNNLSKDGNNPLDNSVVIVDEIHNILNTLAGSPDSKRWQLYKLMMNAKNSKFILLSGTPITNAPFEICPAINIVRGSAVFDVHSKDAQERFMNHYFRDYKLIHKNEFARKVQGLISYFSGIPETVFPQKRVHRVQAEMSPEQWKLQVQIYNEEDNSSKNKNRVIGVAGSDFESQIKTLKRARALKVRGTLRSVLTVSSSLDSNNDDDESNFFVFARENSNFSYPSEVLSKYSLENNAYILNKDKLSSAVKMMNIRQNLPKFSAKMQKIIDTIATSTGPVMVYSNFEAAYGIQIFTECLKAFGYNNYGDGNGPSFAIWSGQTDQPDREKILKAYNSSENMNGNVIKVLCITSAGKEGISLKGVRQIHIMEPWWNMNRTLQVIGRGVRICSHWGLPKKDQVVDIYNYISVPPRGTENYKEAIDISILKGAIKKQKEESELLLLLQESSIDCTLNKARTLLKECKDFSNYPHQNVFVDNPAEYLEDDITVSRITYNGVQYYMTPELQVYTQTANPEYIGNATIDPNTNTVLSITMNNIENFTVIERNGRKYLQKGTNIYQYLSTEDLKIGLKPVKLN